MGLGNGGVTKPWGSRFEYHMMGVSFLGSLMTKRDPILGVTIWRGSDFWVTSWGDHGNEVQILGTTMS